MQTGTTSSSLTAQRVRVTGIASSIVLPVLFNSPIKGILQRTILLVLGLERIDSGLAFPQTPFFLTASDSLVIAFSREKNERFSCQTYR
jgi:hypothetical protein